VFDPALQCIAIADVSDSHYSKNFDNI
jgi:hypothetical protein